MPTLLYRGFDPDGRRCTGSGNFATEAQMVDYLQKKGIVNYEIHKSETVYKHGLYSVVSPKELSIFCKQMSVLFFSHITLMEGIMVLVNQAENKHLKLALKEIHTYMEKGYTFSESIGMYEHIFSPYLLNMIEIGETSGSLDDVLSRMSAYYDKESRIRKKIKSALMYPAVLTTLMVAVVLILIVRILPMFGSILDNMGAQIPTATNILLNGGTFLVRYGVFILLVIVAIVVALMYYFRTIDGKLKLDKIKFSIPAYRYINSRISTSRFARSMSILLKSGVQLLTAMEEISILMDNSYLESKLKIATEKMKNGSEASEVLEEVGVFPSLFLKMFVVGLKTGNLDEMLDKSAAVFDDEADDAIESVTTMLEPILIVILSIIVGIILLSVMLPMISIMNGIG